jgi:hypothetical protein
MNHKFKKPLPVSKWTPLRLPNLVCWYDFMTQTSGDYIRDYSKNKNHIAFPAAAANKPTWSTDGNSKPCLYFNGSNFIYSGTTLKSLPSVSVLCCAIDTSSTASDKNYFLVGYPSGPGLHIRMMEWSNTQIISSYTSQLLGLSYGVAINSSISSTSAVAMMAVQTTSITGCAVNTFPLTTSAFAMAADAVETTFNKLCIGSYTQFSTTPFQTMIGNYYQFAISSSILTQSDFNNWRRYCTSRTGISYGI